MLNRDSSAMSSILPHWGQFGRPRLLVTRSRVANARQADWTVIVGPPRRPHRTLRLSCIGSVAPQRRGRETLMAESTDCTARNAVPARRDARHIDASAY